MTAWIIYFREAAEYNRRNIEFYREEGAKLDIHVRLILVEELEFGVRENRWFITYQGKVEENPDFVICRAIYPLLSRQLELMGIKVFNNSFVSEICNDKARTYQYLAKTGITMVNSSFYRNMQVKEILSDVKKPTVIKAVDGHGGSQVFLMEPEIPGNNDAKYSLPQLDESKHELKHSISSDGKEAVMIGLGNSDVVVQPLTGSRHQDLRVYVIGTEIVAAVLRTAKEGFKSNFSLGGEVCMYQLSKEELEIVQRIIEQFDFGLVGIDFIIGDEGEFIFNEIEDVVGARMLYQSSDINLAGKYLNYICQKLNNQ